MIGNTWSSNYCEKQIKCVVLIKNNTMLHKPEKKKHFYLEKLYNAIEIY